MRYGWRLGLALLAILGGSVPGEAQQKAQMGTVTVTTGKPVNTFVPSEALGAGVDGQEHGDIERIYQPKKIAAMRSTGLRPLSYRLRTELGIQAWHWNPAGHWTDAAHKQGYWISNATAFTPITISNGYNLPRRGSTIDQASNRGYSRLDDGDPATFWKSNPYLSSLFTRESDDLHPQWIVMDFGRKVPLDTVRILWGTPFATRYQIEWWTGNSAIPLGEGDWKVFPLGKIAKGHGGEETVRLSTTPMRVRYVRVLLQQAQSISHTGVTELADEVGYAIREIYAGTRDTKGKLHDIIQHGRSNHTQTQMYASSTDCWHRAEDLDKNTEQPGFDRVFESGLTNGLPMLTPVGMLYDTPENAAAEIRYLKAKGVPLTRIELGEEPDGQYITPEDYGALYIQWADAIHAVAPELQLGGPGFQTDIHGWYCWPDKNDNGSWINRFVNYLKRRNRLKDFAFFSFEWYPFDNVNVPPAPQLAQHEALLRRVLGLLAAEGVPRSIPWIITEYGYSSFATQAEVDLPGALLNAEIAAEFLTLGGKAAYLYGYEPNTLIQEGANTWGNLTLFLANDDGTLRCPLPCYYGARLLTQEWAQPGDGVHELFPAVSNIHNAAGQSLVTAFATRRPDGQWAVLLLNKDPKRSYDIRLQFRNPETKRVLVFKGAVRVAQYGPEQYHWKPNGRNGYPTRNLPPKVFTVSASTKTLHLPAWSLTVVRGKF